MTEPGPSGIVSNYDYSSLIQNSNETTAFKSDLLQELNNEFNTEEQSIFVNSFYSYLNYHPIDDYVIDLSDVYEWIGFTRLDSAKKNLVKKFREGIDYQILLRQLAEQVKVNGGAGMNKEKIMMNIETFKGLCMVSGTDKASKIRGYFLKLQELIIKCKNKQIKELTLYNELGQSNQLQFDGIFKGKESEIRITSDKRISVFDFIRVVGGQTQPDKTWKNIVNNHNEEVRNFYTNFKFQGQGQKLTPVINVQGMVKLLFCLPGEMAKQFRAKSAEVMIRYLGGDLTLINEIKQIDNHHVTNPNNVAQIFREEVSENQIQQSKFNQDQINNSKRLLENFGDKRNVMYNLIFNHKDFGWLSKIGIVRELRGFYNRFQEHEEDFGEVCIHSVIQCTNIEQVEKDFKDTSLFKTNRVKVPKNNGDGYYTEILQLTELLTMETITNEIKRVANDRILDPPPVYIENTLPISDNLLDLEQEKTKQIESKEKTRQIEIQQQELTKREQSDKEIRLAQIQADKEIRLAEIELEKLRIQQQNPVQVQKQSEPVSVPQKDMRIKYINKAINDKIPEMLTKFLQEKTAISNDEDDYIFLSDLFKSFNELYSNEYTSKFQMFNMLLKQQENIITKKKTRKKLVAVVCRKWR